MTSVRLTPPRLAFAACLALAILHTWPLASAPAHLSLNYNADAQQGEWTLAWIAHVLPRAPTHLFDGNIFAPERATIAFSEPMVVPALIGAPIRWLGGSPVLTYNLVLIAGLTLTAWAGWFGVWRWTGSFGAGLVGGALTGFNAHLLTRLPHIMAAHAWGIPLSLYLADRLAEQPGRRDALLLALVVLATAATSIYWLGVVGVVIVVVTAVNAHRRRSIAAIAAACFGGLLIALPVLWPYLQAAGAGASRPLSMVAQFSATPAGYITSLSRLHKAWSSRFFRDEVNVLFAGAVPLVLATVGIIWAVREPAQRRRAMALIVAAATAFLLSLGPSTWIYRWLYHWVLPLRGLRAVARFGYLYLTAVAMAAGFGVAWLQRRAKSPASAVAIAAAALFFVTAETWSGPIRTEPFKRVPPIYDLLANTGAPVMLVEVPFYPAEAVFENGEYVLNATEHWQPLMNGTSGVTPMSYRARADLFWFFPRDWAIDAIERDTATHIMVHLEKFTPSEVVDIEQVLPHRHELHLIASDPIGHRLYRIQK